MDQKSPLGNLILEWSLFWSESEKEMFRHRKRELDFIYSKKKAQCGMKERCSYMHNEHWQTKMKLWNVSVHR